MDIFIQKTTAELNAFLKKQYQTQALHRGFFQKFHPKTRLLFIITLVVFVNLTRYIHAYAFWILYALIILFFSNINPFKKATEVAKVSFLFAGLLALPAIFSFITPGNIIFKISDQVGITLQGVKSALTITLRAFSSLLYAALLLATTSQNEISKALYALKIPDVFIMIFSMTIRYAVVFTDKILETLNAVKSRTLGQIKNKKGIEFAGKLSSDLFRRTSAKGNEVYYAMTSRGYTGIFSRKQKFSPPATDFLWLTFNILLLIILRKFFM